MMRYRFSFELEFESYAEASSAIVAIQERLDISPIEVSLVLGSMRWFKQPLSQESQKILDAYKGTVGP